MWVFPCDGVGQEYAIWLHVRRSLRSSICTQCTENCSKTKIEGIRSLFFNICGSTWELNLTQTDKCQFNVYFYLSFAIHNINSIHAQCAGTSAEQWFQASNRFAVILSLLDYWWCDKYMTCPENTDYSHLKLSCVFYLAGSNFNFLRVASWFFVLFLNALNNGLIFLVSFHELFGIKAK